MIVIIKRLDLALGLMLTITLETILRITLEIIETTNVGASPMLHHITRGNNNDGVSPMFQQNTRDITNDNTIATEEETISILIKRRA